MRKINYEIYTIKPNHKGLLLFFQSLVTILYIVTTHGVENRRESVGCVGFCETCKSGVKHDKGIVYYKNPTKICSCDIIPYRLKSR